MPVVDIKLNVGLEAHVLERVVADVTETLSTLLGPSCRQVMVSHAQGGLYVNGSPAPAALVDVRLVGPMSLEAKRQVCQRIAQALSGNAEIEPTRLFLQFSHVSPDDAWNVSVAGPTCVLDRAAGKRPRDGTLRATDTDPSS